MKNELLVIVLASFVILGLFGCAAQQTRTPTPFQPVQLNPASYSKKVDTFAVVLDASSSMKDNYQGRVKFDQAREILSRMNQTIPPLDYKAGLVAFGCDPKLFTYSQPVRVPGAFRDGRLQRLIWVLSSPAEPQETISYLQRLAENNSRVIHLHQEPLSHIAALLSMVDHYLGNDSGISHLAGAMHCRGTVLFGPTDPQIWRPSYEGTKLFGSRGKEIASPWLLFA